ncbi:MAG: hypothetical protein ACPGXZ_06970 [Saprospiraceae bacterium]
MKRIAKVNKMLWLALLVPTIIILSSFIGNTEPTSIDPNEDNDTVETLNTSGVKINHIKYGDWSKDFPNVAFDNITYNRKGRPGTNNIYGYNVTDSHKPKNTKPYVFRWDKSDTKTNTWWPQGVSGNGNSDLGGNKRMIMNSWYSKGKHGARITIMDISDPANIKYRHILLVESTNREYTFEELNMKEKYQKEYKKYPVANKYTPVKTHAGGVSWYKNFVYIADTRTGIRVFDLNKIFKTEGKNGKKDNNKCGFVDGKYHAFNYEYAIPQVAIYHIKGASSFACISLENVNGRRKLWTANFKSRVAGDAMAVVKKTFSFNPVKGIKKLHNMFLMPKDKKKHIYTNVYGYDLNEDGTVNTDPATVEGYKYKYAKIRGVASKTGAKVVTGDTKLDINGVNGVYREGDKVWLSRNMAPHYKASTCRLVIQEGDKPAEMWRFPHTSEDFYYEKDTDILWSCTEAPSGHLFVWSAMDTKAILKNTKNIGKKPSNRIMFGVKRSSYK